MEAAAGELKGMRAPQRAWLAGCTLLAALVAAATVAFAGGKVGNPEQTLTLHAKDPKTWRIVAGGGRGTLTYHTASGRFALSAQGLAPQTGYLLVRYAENPPLGEIVGQGRSDNGGALQLSGAWHDWTRKFWLVTASDVTELAPAGDRRQGRLSAWHPKDYLFEEKILGIPCVCDP